MKIETKTKKEDPKFLIICINGREERQVFASFFRRELSKKFHKFSSKSEFEIWFQKTELRAAKRYLIFLLSKRNYPWPSLKEKLFFRKVSLRTIEKVFQELSSYFNDDEWISNFIEKELKKGFGPHVIAKKLKLKNFDEKKIEEGLKHLTSELLEEKILEAGKKLLQKKISKEKAMRALFQKGFDSEMIYDVFRKV